MKLRQGYKLIVIGDSITDCDRARPVGEGLYHGLGHGYVNLLQSLIRCEHPSFIVQLINMGISGNTIRDLAGRWQRDVLEHEPDGVIIGIGINDVWRKYDNPMNQALAVLEEEYERTLNKLIDSTQAIGAEVMLLTPFFIEPNKDEPMRADMDRYGAIVKTVGECRGLPVVDLQQVMDRFLAYTHPSTLALDRVHPNQTGHMAIAKAIVEAL
ncbi:SGNH/GDSL hydrolase family protein [Paenibacillus aquistagni]|uniref:Lysophospholipase L1 n=1 Tax=Paenibacillus aquistagni TaxID=1852522 RepID=A0A1X7K5S8_9BACL|nr:SGNH/GDSL hydrolase family protein [Paenibacillus aquistagni]SMG35578.1 Lysophospholipase L1 [Paenibacillus aquistagni]